MKYKIKKNRLKIFIALSLMITCVFGVMFATNTFAYETDTFSYTINDITTNSQNVSITESNNTTIISGYNTTATFNLVMNELTYYEECNYLMINYKIEKSTDNVNWSVYQIAPSQTSTTSTQLASNFVKNGLVAGNSRITYLQNLARFYVMSKGYYSNVIPLYSLNTNNFDFDSINLIMNSNVVGTSYWRITIYNIDIVGTSEIALPQYYETYYAQIEENYNQLLEDYETLEDNYIQLENDYNDLQDDYNNINSQYQDVIDVASNGIWNYIDALDWHYGNELAVLSIDDLKEIGALNGNLLDLGVVRDAYSHINNIYRFTLVFNSSFPLNVNLINMYVEMTDILSYDPVFETTNGAVDFRFQLGHIENNYIANSVQPVELSFSKSSLLPYDNFLNQLYLENQNSNVDMPFYLDYYNAFKRMGTFGNFFQFLPSDNLRFYSYNTQYQIGYQQGLNESNNISKTYYEGIINDKNDEISSLTDDIDELTRANRVLQAQVATHDTYNMNNLIWTIAETPFESFKHIWNVNFFGVNVADFVLGFITTFIALFIIKKIFF